MLISLGPVSSASVLAWLEQARKVTQLLRGDLELPFDVPWNVLDRFERVYDEWYVIADTTDEFVWSGELEPSELRMAVQYWFNIVQYLFENADGATVPLMPLEALAFRDELVPAVMRALAEDEASRPFADVAIERWPGLHTRQYPYGKAAGG